MISTLKKYFTLLVLSMFLSLSLALPVNAAGCGFPPSYIAYGTWKVAEAGDFKTQNGRLFICINGNWQDYGPADRNPNPVNGRIWAEEDYTLVGAGDTWVVVQEKKAEAISLQDPNGRTTADTIGGFFTIQQTIIDPVSGEASSTSNPAIRISGRNLAPGETYFAFATKSMWDQTPLDGWNVQTGEAKQMQNIDGTYTSVVAAADGTASFVVNHPASWEGWNYGRLVKAGGGGGCSAPVQL